MLHTSIGSLPGNKKRIISLVPSITELLADLGLEDHVVGITKFCVHPAEWFRNKPKIGGTKKLNHAAIDALKPGLIIANKEENTKADIELLARNYDVWLTDINTLEEGFKLVETCGELFDEVDKAQNIVLKSKELLKQVLRKATTPKKCCYLIWQEPLMTIGHDTYINDMLNCYGYQNVFADRTRYPEVSEAEIKAAAPEYILLSSEPYPFAEKHVAGFAATFPGATIKLVDGEAFSWYGSRLVHLSADTFFK